MAPFDARPVATRRFAIVLIKPSRYDDEGYVVQWWRSHMPTHSLAVVWGIVEDAANRRVLGPDVDIEITAIDEVTTSVRPERLLPALASAERVLVMMVGVQTNQFPRALDLARPFLAAGHAVAIGGFHVSGTLALTPDWTHGRLDEARAAGISLYAGELENGIDELLADAWAGRPRPLYDKLSELPDLRDAPLPKLLPGEVRKTIRSLAGLDMGRGCPFKCTFCSIINVTGNKVRSRPPEAVEAYLRQCIAGGTRHFLVVDDNFARVRDWNNLLDVFIRLKEETGTEFDIFFQIDTQAHRLPGFVDKVRRAGGRRVFIGIESVRGDNLLSAGKKHNKVQALNDMLMTWKRAGMIIIGTLIVGLPGDTPETLAEDVRFLRELPIDLFESTMLTPVPGSVDHQRLIQAGVALEADLNDYDTEHPVTRHPNMADDLWSRTYRDVWDWFYTPDQIERILVSALRHGLPMADVASGIVGFYGALRHERTHPYQAGVVRRRVRRDRRPGLPLESPIVFYPRYLWRVARAQAGLLALMARVRVHLWRARRAVARGTAVP